MFSRCLSQRRMRRQRCPWRKGRGQVLRTPHPARTPLLARSFLQDKTCRPTRTPLLSRNLLQAKNLHPAKTHLPLRNRFQAENSPQARTPHHARNPLHPQPSLLPRTILLGKSLLQAKTSLPPRTPLPRTFRHVKTCPPARAPCQLSPLPKRPQSLGTHQQPLGTCLWPPGRPL